MLWTVNSFWQYNHALLGGRLLELLVSLIVSRKWCHSVSESSYCSTMKRILYYHKKHIFQVWKWRMWLAQRQRVKRTCFVSNIFGGGCSTDFGLTRETFFLKQECYSFFSFHFFLLSQHHIHIIDCIPRSIFPPNIRLRPTYDSYQRLNLHRYQTRGLETRIGNESAAVRYSLISQSLQWNRFIAYHSLIIIWSSLSFWRYLYYCFSKNK